MYKSLLVLLVFGFCQILGAAVLTTEQKRNDFHYLLSVINAGYGPRDYKAQNKIVSYSELNARFEQEITQTKTNLDFYYKLVEYVASYRDGHFGIYLPTDRVASLPITTDLIEGKILITKIDREKLKEDKFPFVAGDEIVGIDGLSAKEYLDHASRYVASGNLASIRRLASWTVFFRRAQRLPLPVNKTIKLEIRRGTGNVIDTAELSWEYTGQELLDSDPSDQVMPFGWTPPSKTSSIQFDRLDNTAAEYRPTTDRGYSCSGETRIEMPKDATVIMKKPFVAYYHPTAKGNIGYLRIPHYYPQAGPGEHQTDVTLAWVAQYEYAVRELEKNTVGLIIDQDHNCGGSVWIVHKVVSMFMDHPFEQSQFELLANKETYIDFEKWVKETPENSIARTSVQSVQKLIKDTWLKGTSFLTAKTSIDGEPLVFPNPVRYSKPIVILIDELAGSGGDMFPALMKGHGRAKLFGQTTSGLGGHVQEYPAGLPNSQMTFRMTKSLFYRPDGVAIENNGAVPDRFYVITRDDVLYGFKGYRAEYMKFLFEQLP